VDDKRKKGGDRPSAGGWKEANGRWTTGGRRVDDGWTTGGRTTRSNLEFQCKLYTQHLHNFSCNRADLGSTQAVAVSNCSLAQ
jgi:hypothetical protein